MPFTLKRAADGSASWFRTQSDPPSNADAILTPAQWAQLPAGRLKSILTQSYESIADFMAAWASEGGEVVEIGAQNIATPCWQLDPDGGLRLLVGNAILLPSDVASSVIHIGLAYSASE